MTRTKLNLDAKALRGAMRELGTTTREDTVNAALREVAGRQGHRDLAELSMSMGKEEFDEFERSGGGPRRIAAKLHT